MPYIGNNHIVGDHINNFKVLDDISSYTATFDGSSTNVVSTSDETLRIVEHRFVQGQRVTYNNGGGSNIGGLSSGTAYYVSFDTANTIKLATSLVNANNGTLINLTSAGGGTTHTLTAAFDGTNTKFKLTHNGGESGRLNNATQLQVAINNVLQRPNSDPDNFTEGFAVERGNKIVFQTAPTSNDVFWGSIIANSLPTFDIDATAVDNFTGDDSTTDFTLSRIPPNSASIIVTINGVFQHLSDTTTVRAYSLEASVVKFTSAPANGDEIQVRHTGFRGATSDSVTGFYGRTGNVTLTASDDILTRNINSSGIITASSFSGDGSGLIGVASTDNIVTGTAATFNTYPVDINAGMTVAGVATFSGNVSIAGTLTYEDVKNVDSVGIITARKDIHVGAGISAVGIITGQFLMASGGSDANKQNVKIGWMQTENLSTGGYNVLVGRRAGEDVDTGSNLVLIGNNAGQKQTNQSASVMIGGAAGNNSTGDGNVYIGRYAAQQSTSASSNVIIGTYAGIDSQGDENTLVGYYAGRGTSGNTDGTRNTFIGTKAGFKIRGGDDNTSLGRESLVELLGGNKNVAIGQQAGDALVSGNNNIIIGYRADASTSSTSNEITLGDANINHLRIPGIGVSFNNTGGTQLGIITATELDISGDIDVDGHTNLDNVNIAGVTTTGNLYADNLYAQSSLTINSNSNVSVNLTSTSTSGSSRIFFGDPDSALVGRLTYSHNGDFMQFFTAYGERLRIASSGTVLIGTTNATTIGTINSHLVVGSTTNNDEVATTLNVMEGTNNRRVKFFLDDDDGVFGIDSTASTGVAPFVVRMAESEKLRITSGGAVGINETAPSAMLHVENDNANSSTYYLNTDAAILVQNKNSNATAKTVIKLEGPAGSGDCALVYGAGSTNMIFADRQNERLRIASDGHVAIGGYGNPETILDIREAKTGAETMIRLFNTDNGDTTTQTAALYLSPDSRGAAKTGLRAIKENASFANNAGRDISLTLNVTQNNSQVEALRITSTGVVGIGTDSIGAKLTVSADSSNTNMAGHNYLASQSGIIIQNRTISSGHFTAYTGNVRSSGGYTQSGSLAFEATGSGTAPKIHITQRTGGGVQTKRLTIDTDGKVGINKTNPEQELHIVGDSDACVRLTCTDGGAASFQLGDASDTVIGGITLDSSDNSIQIRGNNNAERLRIDSNGNMGLGTNSLVGNAANVYLTINGSTLGGIAFKANGTTQGTLTGSGGEITLSSDGTKPITFDTNGSERFKITTSSVIATSNIGHVLLGTETARSINTHQARLQVTGTTYSHSTVSIINNSSGADGAYLFLGKQRSGAVGGSTAVQANDVIGQIRFNAGDGTDLENYAAIIEAKAQVNATSNNTPGYLDFYTTRQNGSSEHKMRMTQNSNHSHLFSMGTGTSNLNNSSTPDRTSVKIGGLLHLEGPFGHNATPGMYYNCYSGGNDLFYRGTGTPSGGDRRPAAYGQKFGGHYFYGDNSSTAWSAQQQITTMQTNMVITSQGYVSKPNQPSFHVGTPNLAGASSGQVWRCHANAIYSNVGSHYNNSNGRFTAPVDGQYFFFHWGMSSGAGQTNDVYSRKNGSRDQIGTSYNSASGGQHNQFGCSYVRTLAAGDYVDVYTASGGVYNNSDGRHGGWGGWLIG